MRLETLVKISFALTCGIAAAAALSVVMQPRAVPLDEPDQTPPQLPVKELRADAFPRRSAARDPKKPPPKPEWQGAAEKMFLSDLKVHLGRVQRGAQPSHTFPITNVFPGSVEIALQTSCGCISATTDKKLLQPGEAAAIDIRLDTSGFTGAATESVRVKVVGPDFESRCKLLVSVESR